MASLNKASLNSSLQSVRAVARAPRTRRILTGVLIFLIVFGLLGFFAAPPIIRHVAEQQLSKQLDRPVTIGRIALNPYTLRLEADRVHIGERGGNGDFFDVSRAVVQASWSSIFHAAPIVEELRLDSPRATIVRLDAQHFNFSDLIEKFSTPSKPNSKPAQFSVSNIRIENGQITFDDRLLNEKHVIDRWSLGIPFIATLPSKTDIFVQPMLRARIDGASTLAIDGRTKPFSATRESEVELRLTDLDVPKLLTYAPTKLPVTVKSGKLSTNLKLDFVMSGEKPTLRVTGTTDLNDFDSTDNANAPFFGARSLHVAAASLEPFSNAYRFDEIRLDAPTVWVARDKQGVLSVEKLMGASAAQNAPAENKAASAAPASGASAAQSAQAASGEAKPAPLDLSIRQFALTNGTVHIADDLPARPVNLDLTQLSATLANFSSTAKAGAPFTFATTANDGGTAKASGTFSMAGRNAEANIALERVSLPQAQPYIDNLSGAQILDGKLNLTSTLKADWAQQPAVVQVGQSTLGLESLKLAARGAKEPAIALAQGTVQVSGIDLNARKAQIASVDVTGLVMNAERQKDGKIDLAQLASTHQAAPERTAIRAAQKSVREGPAWRYTIDAFTLNNGTINFTDSSTQRPVKLAITPFDLKIQQISDDLRHPLPVDLKATVNRKGTLALSGKINPTPLTAQLKIDANRLDAAAFEPYFGNQLNAVIASALLNMTGQLTVAQGKALKADYRGDAALVDVRMLDKATSAPFAGWRSLALTNLKANYDDARGTDVDASRVTFAGFYGRVLLDAQGKLNLKDVVAHQTGAAQSLTQDAGGKPGAREPVPLTPQAASAPVQTASAPTPASAPATVVAAQPPKNPVRMHFGELVLQDGRVNYTDNFIKPNYTADLVQIHGTVGAFGTQSTTPAPVDVSAKLSANGPLSIKGTVNPLIEKPSLDLTASAHDIELTNLTPYSAKYAGYPITKGKLNVDLHYQLANDQLTANNHLFIDQLTFGDHVDNDTATKLPVRLAISLLKNRKGEIDVNIPVSGSLSNPEFSLGGLIWKAVLNLIAKAVTAPFTLLANAFGGGGEDLGYVEFAAGTATLTDADQKKLDTIVKALDDKPSVKIDLIGRVDPAVDTPALREQYVDRLVRLQKVKDTVGNGESVDTSQVKVDDKEYEKYLTKAYKDADFKKPHNMIGFTKTLPADDMKQALADHAPVDDATLRNLAQQRAQAVQQYFEGKVDASRVFIVAPRLDAKGIDDKGATTRVDFGLK
ncbi:DUF748 domain-containing protein [Paraburkholderia silvatlantica]|uniref:Uncharacterized protein involved in outer membrane biogenesis n=1 Tax=Paraburkholderia silvatlantica TaxID=321895 RepID=A0A2U1A4L3_9BURK|nr:DUF748 domain-containing protein [Paraburkholderia silvatlantica]MBB2931781.1 hypothetical protein [Paraburkholderia silvatlantica]PVY26429.1 uncharacterized protein involved in outer membrane biogenesis [Paraburkholderia silvatlantica]PXW32180.1 uncharacterized protein involved in outer membrane biogenesis [Paraburkholderia silvatlantica]PYE18827.1 uncharacterized protein involved in outer membrane biogenesis [Paraburkholderia silvatlantica]TDQ82760.1 uncharacterized protein involved in ou